MNDIRARFEEIWPVPVGVCWCIVDGGYFAESTEHIPNSIRHNARLDTFTRCQETTDVYVSLVDELLQELEAERNGRTWTGDDYPNLEKWERQSKLLDRAKQIMEQKK